jgi:GNAT superfamily N-acetyltransferase
MDDIAFILGLMKQNTDEVGFIPSTTVSSRYIAEERYIIQRDRRGRQVGYILHGKPTAGGVLTVAQAVVEVDHRDKGFGQMEAMRLIERAKKANARAVKLRCASDLDANAFWLAMGFEHTNTLTPENRRQRAINAYLMDLWPTLFKTG